MKKSPLFTIFLVVFLDLLGFGIVIPILPYFAEQYGGGGLEVGLLMMSYSAMQFVFSPFWGRLSDHYGRRPIILLCILGLGFSMLLFGMADSMAMLFASRLLGGFFGANISAASAYIADVTPPEKRAKGMGMIGAAFGLGFLFGPAIGGLLSKWSFGAAGYFAAGLSLINFIFAFMVLKEPKLSDKERQAHRRRAGKEFWIKTFSKPQTALAILLFFLATLGMAQLETSFALYLLQKFNLQAFHAGLILTFFGFIMAGIQGGAIGKLAKKFGEVKLIVAGSLLGAIGLIGSAYMPVLSLFVVFLTIHAIGYAVTNPSLMSLTSQYAEEGAQGGTLGVYQSAGSLGRILGPLFAGILFDYWGVDKPFLVAGFIFAFIFILALWKGKVWR